MKQATPKRKAITLSRTERKSRAVKEFKHSKSEQEYIAKLHDLDPKRSASNREKQIVVDKKAKNDKLTHAYLVDWALKYLNLKVSQPTVSRWLKDQTLQEGLMTDFAGKAKCKKSVKFPEFERKLKEWFLMYQHCLNMTGDLIRQKAELYRDDLGISQDELALSGGWLDAFKARYGIQQFLRSGESGDVDMALVEEKQPEIRSILDQYSLSDIYNMDETSLFYQQEDNRSLATKRSEGRKSSKKRLTLALCCNADGTDKTLPFIIGHSQQPHCFRNVNLKRIKCTYRSNSKAWMTTTLFAEWLRAFDQRMIFLKKKEVVLILDNFAGHMSSKMVDLPTLERTRLLYLPPNTTSKLQPLDAGIIRNFKLYYRKRFNRCLLDRLEDMTSAQARSHMDSIIGINRSKPPVTDIKKVANIHVLDAMKLTISAWDDVKQETTHNCFLHCGIRTPEGDQEVMKEDAVGLDEGAVSDVERSFRLLNLRNGTLFPEGLDIREILNREEENVEMEEFADTYMTAAELLAADVDEEDEQLSEEEKKKKKEEEEQEELPLVSRRDAHTCLRTIERYILQQDSEEGDMSKELASIKFLLDFCDMKRVLTLQQSDMEQFLIRH